MKQPGVLAFGALLFGAGFAVRASAEAGWYRQSSNMVTAGIIAGALVFIAFMCYLYSFGEK